MWKAILIAFCVLWGEASLAPTFSLRSSVLNFYPDEYSDSEDTNYYNDYSEYYQSNLEDFNQLAAELITNLERALELEPAFELGAQILPQRPQTDEESLFILWDAESEEGSSYNPFEMNILNGYGHDSDNSNPDEKSGERSHSEALTTPRYNGDAHVTTYMASSPDVKGDKSNHKEKLTTTHSNEDHVTSDQVSSPDVKNAESNHSESLSTIHYNEDDHVTTDQAFSTDVKSVESKHSEPLSTPDYNEDNHVTSDQASSPDVKSAERSRSEPLSTRHYNENDQVTSDQTSSPDVKSVESNHSEPLSTSHYNEDDHMTTPPVQI